MRAVTKLIRDEGIVMNREQKIITLRKMLEVLDENLSDGKLTFDQRDYLKRVICDEILTLREKE